MNERTRYRLTGSLLLLALLIIFVPMLFDSDEVPLVELAPVDEDYLPPTVQGLQELAVPESDFAERVQALREQADDQGFHRETRTRIGEPVLSPPSADTSAWAVQVGSFADVDKALAFRDRLRADGNEAFTSGYKTDDGAVLSRVAVGPLLDQARAARLAEDLSARYEVEAVLMAFGN